MTPEIKERIDQIRNGIVPEGYKRIKDALVPAEWSTYKISDFATINQGFTFSRDFQGNSNDEWNYFKVADIGLNLNSRYLTKALNTISEDTMHQIGCVPFKAGSIVFPRVGAALLNNNKKILAQDSIVDDNVLVLSVTDANICVNEFIYYALQNMRLESWCNSGLVPVISAKIVYKYILYLPSIREQQKIAEILSVQDKLIELEQQKIEEIIKVKRFFLEKMFPKKGEAVPEIRFKGFTDPWEQRKLGELPEKTYGGGTPSTTNVDYWNGNIPWLQSSDISEGKLFDVTPKKFISQSGLNDSAAQLVPENSIAIITRVGIGKLAFLPFSYTTSQDFLSMSRLTTAPYFTVYACYKKLQSELNSVQGTSIKRITKDELLAKEIKVPSYEEQKQIGEYFCSLDRLITLHQRKLEEEKKKKKALMQLLLTGIVRV